MAKVKKGAGVTSGRNVTARKAASKVRTKKATVKTGTKRGTRTVPKTARKVGKRVGKAAGRRAVPEPVVRIAVRALDPHRKCGPGTSVQSLYRVDETVDGRSTAHLVFNDRHGWYCEHGRTCPAVGHAKKYDGRIARAS